MLGVEFRGLNLTVCALGSNEFLAQTRCFNEGTLHPETRVRMQDPKIKPAVCVWVLDVGR